MTGAVALPTDAVGSSTAHSIGHRSGVTAPTSLIEDNRLADRNQIRPVASFDFCHLSAGPVFDIGQLPTEISVLPLQFQHPLHPGQVQTFVGQLLDAQEQRDVDVAVAPAPPEVRAGSSRPLRS